MSNSNACNWQTLEGARDCCLGGAIESAGGFIQHQELISKETLATELSIVAGAASCLQIGETGQLDISVVKN